MVGATIEAVAAVEMKCRRESVLLFFMMRNFRVIENLIYVRDTIPASKPSCVRKNFLKGELQRRESLRGLESDL